ncbi:DnaJ-domain-containing protein [Periconia macrospinosa]|uniref:DnaJ-domain-containing protein n=1 Tax=Periconia macrospinosa TaxID=97972 RepID=A0A2V1D948_9PLEO|nr:DnaJ-domain-containing protein [Periconia macrospinosa]
MSSSKHINGKTYYEILRLPTTCTVEEIKKAYKQLQLKHHPDKTRGLPQDERSASEALSKAINSAYEVLGDEYKRRSYDRSFCTSTTPPASSHPSTPSHQPKPPTPPTPPKTPKPQYHDESDRFSPFEPETTSQSLHFSSVRWKFSIHLNPRFESTTWGPNYTWDDENNILIFIKLAKQTPRAPPILSPNDISLSISRTPDGRTITKLESYYKHRMTDQGPELNLWIKVFTNPHAAFLPKSWQFEWDIEAWKDAVPPNPTCQQYGTNLYFWHEPPNDTAPRPTREMMRDRDMKPAETLRFARLGVPQFVTTGNVSMYRVAAFGYQTDGTDLPHTPQHAGIKYPQSSQQGRNTAKQAPQSSSSSRKSYPRAQSSQRYAPYKVPTQVPDPVSRAGIQKRWMERIEKARAGRRPGFLQKTVELRVESARVEGV